MQASALARFAGQGRQIPTSSVLERFAAGIEVPEPRVRRAYVVELDRVARKIQADTPTDDDGWQRRHEAATRVARKTVVCNGQDLLDAVLELPERARPSVSAARSAVRTLTEVVAQGGEVPPADLVSAIAVMSGAGNDDHAAMIAQQVRNELAGRDIMPTIADVVCLPNLCATLDETSITDLQRAASAIRDGVTLQNLVISVGLLGRYAPNVQLGPLKQIDVAALRSLQTDPGWLAWGQQVFTLNYRRFSTGLALHSLHLLVTPWLLDEVEAYVGRLKALVAPIEEDLAACLFQLSNDLITMHR